MGIFNHLFAFAPSITFPWKDAKNNKKIPSGSIIKERPLKYLYSTRCVEYIIKIPINMIDICFIIFEKIKLAPKFELALYTGKNENIAKAITTIQIALSPRIFLSILIIFLHDF